METNILTSDQIAFLKALGQSSLAKHFYLTGGTPLAAFYLHHRYSEDLDFFSESEVDLPALNVFFKEHKNKLGFTQIDFQQTYNRNLFFLTYPGGILKTEFTYFPFKRIQTGEEQFGIQLDSLYDIAINKLFTIYQRTKARDYIDLYMICESQKLSLSELSKQARIKFDWHIDPLQLGTQFMKVSKADDYPRMLVDIQAAQWQSFFVEEAKKLKMDILK